MSYTYTGKDFTDYVSPASPGTPLNEANLDPNGLAINEIQALYGKSGAGAASINGSLSIVGGQAIFNSGYGDYDFTIRKNSSGDAYKYDTGADTHTFGSPITISSGNLTLSSGNFSASGSITGGAMEISGTVAGNIIGSIVNASATGYGLKIQNGTDSNYVLGLASSTGYPFHQFFGNGTYDIIKSDLSGIAHHFTYDGNYVASGSGTFGSDVKTSASTAFVIGDGTTEGDWRIIRDGNNLVHQRLESSTWVTKHTITP